MTREKIKRKKLQVGSIKSIFLTLRLELSFPAKAKSNVVFPELGGPRSNVILQKHPHMVKIFLLFSGKKKKKKKNHHM